MTGIQMTLDEDRTIRSAVVLANAGEVAARIVNQIAGNELSTSINGTKLSTEMIQGLLYRRMAARAIANGGVR